MNAPGIDGLPQRPTAGSVSTDSPPVGMAIFTRDRRLQVCNRHFVELTGLPRHRLQPGLPLEDLLAALGHHAGTSASRWERSDGRVIDVHSETIPGIGHVMIATDVTPLRQAEDALLMSKAATETAEDAKARFIDAVSAELRTPLTKILAETAEIVGNQAARTAIENSAQSLLGLIDEMLEMTRFEAGQFDLAEERIDLAALLRSVLRRFDPQAAASEVTLVIDLPLSLPAVRGDAHRLRRAFSDVMAHALVDPQRFGSVVIRARQDWATGAVQLQFQDGGAGMDRQGLERLLQPFSIPEQPDRRRHTRDTLGLYVVRLIMRAHGGEMAVRSAPGQGTTVTLTIPAGRVVQDAAFNTN